MSDKQKSKKLNLDSIKVNSFTTTGDPSQIKGGETAGTICSNLIACTTGPTDLSFEQTICFNDCIY